MQSRRVMCMVARGPGSHLTPRGVKRSVRLQSLQQCTSAAPQWRGSPARCRARPGYSRTKHRRGAAQCAVRACLPRPRSDPPPNAMHRPGRARVTTRGRSGLTLVGRLGAPRRACMHCTGCQAVHGIAVVVVPESDSSGGQGGLSGLRRLCRLTPIRLVGAVGHGRAVAELAGEALRAAT